ncbi:MAG TPA: lysyl oxidase family protein [Solirubrobacteraceae bacterium]|nr:lysyl oxidase family protein [Solirubrobacteraceae bacterium]
MSSSAAILLAVGVAAALSARAAAGAAGAQTPASGATAATTSSESSSASSTTLTTSSAALTTTTTTTETIAANPCQRRSLHLRCPDLVMSAPSELHLDTTTIPGRLLLRATSSVNSLGAGPIELRARRGAHRRWIVSQAIYDRRGHVHLFRTRVQLVYKYIPGYRYEYGYVGSTSYWKVRHLASFQLWSLGPHLRLERLVRTGPKVDYCLRDLARTHPSRRSPTSAVYPGCSEQADISHDLFGTSVGWSDIYPYGYPEQWIDVTGLRGRFAFVQIVNPRNLWWESNTANNASETFVQLPSGRVIGERVGVPAP